MRAGGLPDVGSVGDVLEQSSDISVYLDADSTVQGISVNPESASLGCLDHWVGRSFKDFLTSESVAKFAQRLTDLAKSTEGVVRAIELNHMDNAKWEFPVRYTLHRIDDDGGLLLIGRDMQPLAEVQQRLVQEQLARERDQQLLRSEKTLFRVVLEESETPIIIVDPEKARIHEINSAAAALLGSKSDTLEGNLFPQSFEGRRRGEFMDALQAAANSESARSVEVVSRRNGRVLSLRPKYFRAAGELMLLCVLEPTDDSDIAGPEFAQSLVSLYAASTDAIVLIDGKGFVREANEAFLVMVDAMQLRDVQDQSLSEFLMRGSVDLKLLLESAAKKGRVRHYSAQLKSGVGTRTPVDISISSFRQRGGELAFGLIVRDTSSIQLPDVEDKNVMVSEEAMRNVMDLVGTASLKDLVSATSDVVEKMCIETAVQMTNNNRVAAAEMLGLSRQSLYVKLRKYGLLEAAKDD
ncbi:transcriptional regulator PpsR [uncultured Roseovarius sp.]|uniref:transcriptional regulator PpsR n=1 Tax=uncultured Roseovarius sp. TaxID=293344 RepID=UPI0025F313C7|nr:transcriptional regulator PpsR [uncultured Roseovarius sp.]